MSQDFDFHVVNYDGDAGHDRPAALARLLAQPPTSSSYDLKESAQRFRPGKDLQVAINTAVNLGAPLLLTGEPGTGKTQVAYFLGWYFGIEVFPFQVTSQARAEDLRFEFDAVGYLRTAHDPDDKERRRPRSDFLHRRALWKAYEHKEPCVLLIDEIDKAPRDFPNDLLREMDQHQFEDPLTQELVKPKGPRVPIVVITSNVERRLPEPFLRRCIFHHIELKKELLIAAVNAHKEHRFPALSEATLEVAMKRFEEVRNTEGLRKKPTTGELLVWLSVLGLRGDDDESRNLLKEVRLADLPGLNALVKDVDDLKKVHRE